MQAADRSTADFPIFDVTVSRLQRASELAATADRAVAAGEFASALMLYVPALEMVGWEINRQLRLGEFIKANALGRRLHQLRHFSAAAVFVADALSMIGDTARAELDFTKLSFIKSPRPGGSKREADWEAQAAPGSLMSMLGAMLSPTFNLPDMDHGSNQEAVVTNTRSAMYFLGCAALGFLDNQRLSVLHEDNQFAFESHNEDGIKTAAQSPDLIRICGNYAAVLPVILSGLKKPEVFSFLDTHLKSMMLAFEGPLKTDSYLRAEAS